MKKQLNTEAIQNELAGSVFFPSRAQERVPHEQHEDTVIPRHPDTIQPSNHDTVIPQNEDNVLELVRRSVKRIGKEAATHRCTLEERQAVDDIEYQYKRQGIRTSGNEITRIAVNYIVEDYKKNGENSIIAKVLKKLNA